MTFADIIWSRAIMALIFYALVLGTLLYHHLRGGKSAAFNLLDLVMENGRASKWSVIIMMTFGLSCLFVTGWWIVGSLTWGDFMGFCGVWVVPLLAKMFAPAPPKEGP